ncbi:unnamed protein product [Ceutorhynchus assimilis]|uniref:Single-strand selective monofunctional uracil DNA glycosylase n=1 Tax=Ceutorhynchus assimilis TaxID=467358 RepID=A0A9N9MK50_9CUCU|nr:unnamed protein product [Ceutorhynchus assimilis]
MLRQKLFGENTGAVLDLSLPNCAPSEVSRYFPNIRPPVQEGPLLADRLIQIQSVLNQALSGVDFRRAPVEYVYNPTEYARAPFELYLRKYSNSNQKILLVGMNPGPFGMCQTGVPFGDVNWVKNWLKIEGAVQKPALECPQRPVQGFACTKKEQSGDRFWKFWQGLCTEPEQFFHNAFVYNYCPLAFINGAGKNLTPAELKVVLITTRLHFPRGRTDKHEIFRRKLAPAD